MIFFIIFSLAVRACHSNAPRIFYRHLRNATLERYNGESSTYETRSLRASKRKQADIDFSASSLLVAKQLIGTCLLISGVGGIIVETEAYDESEAASHGFTGPSLRNAPLFGPPGRAYVYLSYGIYWCLNIVCREAGHAAGVLIRALEPTNGIALMARRRGLSDPRLLCSGPGRLGEALAVSVALNGKRIDKAPFQLLAPLAKASIVRGERIGITKATERAWRFGLKGSAFLSRPFI
jgi:DNA-3-methyladenine glycosylase